LFQRLHYQRGVAALRLADQEVHMLGHDHIAGNHKTITAANLLQYLEKEIAIPRAVKKCAAMVTTGRDKVQASRRNNDGAGWACRIGNTSAPVCM
jgi:hypothetical protein